MLLTLPDPVPEQLATLSEVSILTTMSVLSERLSSEAGSQIRAVVAPALQKAGARGAASGR